MLNEILDVLVGMYSDRHSSTVYSGFGTTIDRMVDEYHGTAGWTPETRRIIRHIDDLAYARAMEAREIGS